MQVTREPGRGGEGVGTAEEEYGAEGETQDFLSNFGNRLLYLQIRRDFLSALTFLLDECASLKIFWQVTMWILEKSSYQYIKTALSGGKLG